MIECFQVIGECHSTRVNAEVAAMYRALNNSQDKEDFIEFCLHNILYQPSSHGFVYYLNEHYIISCEMLFQIFTKELFFLYSGGSSPGLSIAQANRIAGKHQLTNGALLERKVESL